MRLADMLKARAEYATKYPDYLVLFKVGDFYESIGDDAKRMGKVCGLTLTYRHSVDDGELAMVGVPAHSVEGYLRKLIVSGLRVALAELVVKPKPVESDPLTEHDSNGQA